MRATKYVLPHLDAHQTSFLAFTFSFALPLADIGMTQEVTKIMQTEEKATKFRSWFLENGGHLHPDIHFKPGAPPR